MASRVQEQVEVVPLRCKEEEGWRALERVVAEAEAEAGESKAEEDAASLKRR